MNAFTANRGKSEAKCAIPTGLLTWCQEATSRATVDVVLTRHTVTNNYFKPTTVQSIAINTSVWLSCRSAHISQKNTSKLDKISVRFFWPWLGPPLTTMQCQVLPVLWMTSCFHIMEQIQLQAESAM